MEEKVMTPINRIEPISRIIPRQPIKKTEPITLKSMKTRIACFTIQSM